MSLLLSNQFSVSGTDVLIPQVKFLSAPWEQTPIIIKGIEIYVFSGTGISAIQVVNTYNPYLLIGQHSTPGSYMGSFSPTANQKSYRSTWFEDHSTGFIFPAFSISPTEALNALVNTNNDGGAYQFGVNVLYYRATDV